MLSQTCNQCWTGQNGTHTIFNIIYIDPLFLHTPATSEQDSLSPQYNQKCRNCSKEAVILTSFAVLPMFLHVDTRDLSYIQHTNLILNFLIQCHIDNNQLHEKGTANMRAFAAPKALTGRPASLPSVGIVYVTVWFEALKNYYHHHSNGSTMPINHGYNNSSAQITP